MFLNNLKALMAIEIRRASLRKKRQIGAGKRSIVRSQCFQDRSTAYPYNSVKRGWL